MTDECSGLNVLKLSVLLVIALHGLSITMADAEVPAKILARYHSAEPLQEFPLSPLAVIHRERSDDKVQRASKTYDTSAMVNLVEAPVEVIGPRAVESGTPSKAERKRESRIGLKKLSMDSRFRDGHHACALNGDDEPKDEIDKVTEDKTGDHYVKIAGESTGREARSRMFDEEKEKEVEYNGEEPSNSEMVRNEDEDDDDEDDDDDDDKAANPIAGDAEKRRNLRRKTGRRHRQDPKIWDQWGKWTSCSVSCGAGKLTRWRHCVAGGCSLGEKEAQLKTCTFSAC